MIAALNSMAVTILAVIVVARLVEAFDQHRDRQSNGVFAFAKQGRDKPTRPAYRWMIGVPATALIALNLFRFL
jgi:hypothetical protein